jgi:hypothetical protein
MRVCGQRQAPAALLLGGAPGPFGRRLDVHQGQSGRVLAMRKSLTPIVDQASGRPNRSDSLHPLRYAGLLSPYIAENNRIITEMKNCGSI